MTTELAPRTAADLRYDPQHDCSLIAETLKVLSEAGVAWPLALREDRLAALCQVASRRHQARKRLAGLLPADLRGGSIDVIDDLFPAAAGYDQQRQAWEMFLDLEAELRALQLQGTDGP